MYYITNDLILYLQTNTRNSLAQQLPSKQIASIAAVIAIVLAPLPHVLAIGLLPDSLLTPLVLTVLWLAICWLQQAQQFYVWQWIVLGVVLGLAGLSKYTAIFSALALALVFLLSPRKRWLNQSGFWVACLIALVAISPIIVWNWANAWISFNIKSIMAAVGHGLGWE